MQGVEIIFNFLAGKKSDENRNLIESIKHAFKKVKAELDDHLDAINQNTADVQELNELLLEVEAKVDKLYERIDDIEMLLSPKKLKKSEIRLTPREQEVFMVLYVHKSLSSSEISKRLGFTVEMVNSYLFNLIGKGIPIVKELVEDDVLVFSIDSDFKDLQTRKNILNIDPKIAKQIVNEI